MIYLDSSAVLKLVVREAETPALRDWLVARPDEPLVTSELGRVEVLRAARRVGEHVEAAARLALGDLDLVSLDRTVQDLATTIGAPLLRTLDALHLASAMLLRDDLSAFVAYDQRLADAARGAGLVVTAPAPGESSRGWAD